MKRVLQGIQSPLFVIAILMAAVSGTLAADDPLDKFQSDADVIGKDPAQSPAAPVGESGTPSATAKFAAAAGKYDITGLKLGMPAKEAAAALQTRGLQFKPESVKYDVLPNPLTYGLYALNQVAIRDRGIPPNAEKVY